MDLLPDWLRDWAITEMRELRRAKVAAVLLAAIAFGAGAVGMNWFNASEIRVLERENSALARGIGAVIEPPPTQSRMNWFPVAVGLFVFGCAVAAAAANNQRLVRELRTEVNVMDLAREKAARERDEAVILFKERRVLYAEEAFQRCSRMSFEDGDGTRVPPRVTIRFVSYTGDDQLARRIKQVLDEHVGWSSTFDNSNNPVLMRSEQFKVVFDTAMSLSYGELVRAFQEGDF